MRAVQKETSFAEGKNLYDRFIDIQEWHISSTSTTLLLVCFDLISFISSQVELHVLALANVGIGEERVARKMIHRAMVQVIYAA